MHIRCSRCGLDMVVPPRTEGQRLRCPECGHEFICRLPEAVVVDEPAQAAELVLSEELPEDPPGPVELTEEVEAEAALESVARAVPAAEEALSRAAQDQHETVVRDNPRQWYIQVAGVAAVAVTYEQLKAQAAAGQIKPRSKLWYAPGDLTVAARDVPGLFPDLDAERARSGKAPPRIVPPSGMDDAQAAALAEALGALGDEHGDSDDDPSGEPPPERPGESEPEP